MRFSLYLTLKFGTLPDCKQFNVTKMLISPLNIIENIVGKGENAGNQHFLLFPQCFQNASSTGLPEVKIMCCRVNASYLASCHVILDPLDLFYPSAQENPEIYEICHELSVEIKFY